MGGGVGGNRSLYEKKDPKIGTVLIKSGHLVSLDPAHTL